MFEPDPFIRSKGRKLDPAVEREVPVELAAYGLVRLEVHP